MTFLAALLLLVAVLNVVCAVLNVRNARRNLRNSSANKASAAENLRNAQINAAASQRILNLARQDWAVSVDGQAVHDVLRKAHRERAQGPAS